MLRIRQTGQSHHGNMARTKTNRAQQENREHDAMDVFILKK